LLLNIRVSWCPQRSYVLSWTRINRTTSIVISVTTTITQSTTECKSGALCSFEIRVTIIIPLTSSKSNLVVTDTRRIFSFSRFKRLNPANISAYTLTTSNCSSGRILKWSSRRILKWSSGRRTKWSWKRIKWTFGRRTKWTSGRRI